MTIFKIHVYQNFVQTWHKALKMVETGWYPTMFIMQNRYTFPFKVYSSDNDKVFLFKEFFILSAKHQCHILNFSLSI